MSLELNGTLDDGTPWTKTYAFAGQTWIVPECRGRLARFFPSQYGDLPEWAESILCRTASDAHGQ
jgi:hypothetical protein